VNGIDIHATGHPPPFPVFSEAAPAAGRPAPAMPEAAVFQPSRDCEWAPTSTEDRRATLFVPMPLCCGIGPDKVLCGGLGAASFKKEPPFIYFSVRHDAPDAGDACIAPTNGSAAVVIDDLEQIE